MRTNTTTPQRTAIQLGGFVPFSASDYPNHLVCVAFIQGCNWRCGYCHNPHLQSRQPHPMAPQWADITDFLQQRQGLLDAIVFSGGEPTMDPGLPAAILEAKSIGFKIGLHTTGAYPNRFKEILPHIDWVGFDLKSSWAHYHDVILHQQPIEMVQRSLALLLDSHCDYEIRSTLHSGLHQPEHLLEMAQSLAAYDVQDWVIQNFRTDGCIDPELLYAPHEPQKILNEDVLQTLKAYVPNIQIR